MGFKGRIVALLFLALCRGTFVILDIKQHDILSFNEILITILMFIPMYFFGLQYDKARYYSKEVNDIFEDGHIMLWKWERKTNKAKVSSGCERIYGYSSHEFHKNLNLWLNVVYEKDKKIAKEFEEDTLKGRSCSSQYRIVHKGGKIKWIQNMANPVFGKNGKLVKINGVTIDITIQKEHDVNYRKLIDTSPVTNIIIKNDEILYINHEGLKLLGATHLSDVVGKKLNSFLSSEQRTLSAQRLQPLCLGEIDKLPFHEFKLRKLDGTFIDVESTAIRTLYNDEEALLVVAKDITEDKIMKQKWKEAEEKYRSISEESLVGVYMFEETKVTYINKEVERILGYTRDEIGSMNLLDLFVEEHHHIVRGNISKLLHSNMNTLTEVLIMKTKHGELRDVEIRSVVASIQNKKVIIGTIIDVTNEKRAQNELKKVLKELQDIKFALDVSAIVSITDSDRIIVYVNDKFCEISKYGRYELIGRSHELFIPDYHSDKTIAELWETIQAGHVWKGETKRKSKDGQLYWFDTTVVPILDDDKKPYHYISIQFDITEKIKSQQSVKYMAYYDSLTGLLNRNSLNQYLNEQLKTLNPKSDTLSILFIDFDRFKNINDSLGHKYGDLMLKKASDLLIESVQKKGQVFRYGGDEFVIVLTNNTSQEAEQISKKIIGKFSDSFFLNGVEVFTTPSIGISLYPNIGENAEELLKAADMAMYFAKESGKNNFKFFDTSIGEKANKMVVIETELRKAIKENQFILYFQPKINLLTKETIGYESLIRWNHPEMGMIPPCDFIPIAEDTGLIVKLGAWVLEQACLMTQKINADKTKHIPIAVNISVKQFADTNFLMETKEIIHKTQCDTSLLEFEITETVMKDVSSSIKIVKELKKMGIKISIDDFGTGYSNLSILSEMDIDILKIDRTFVEKLTVNAKSLSLVRTIISMGHSLGFKIVAEGVETIEQLELLKQFHCDIGQGYYLGQPITVDEILNK